MKFEITIPVYNEERAIKRQIDVLMKYISLLPESDSVLVSISDNGSQDATQEIARQLCEEYPNKIKYYRLEEKGVGRALKAAWDESEADVVGYMDLDFSTPLDTLKPMMESFHGGSEVFSASRYLPGAEVVGRGIKRGICSVGLNWLLKLILNVKFSDAMAGFKFLKRTLYEELRASGLDCDGWFFNAEILIRSEWKEKSVTEIPIRWEDDPNSKVNLSVTIRDYLARIAKLRKEKFAQGKGW